MHELSLKVRKTAFSRTADLCLFLRIVILKPVTLRSSEPKWLPALVVGASACSCLLRGCG